MQQPCGQHLYTVVLYQVQGFQSSSHYNHSPTHTHTYTHGKLLEPQLAWGTLSEMRLPFIQDHRALWPPSACKVGDAFSTRMQWLEQRGGLNWQPTGYRSKHLTTQGRLSHLSATVQKWIWSTKKKKKTSSHFALLMRIEAVILTEYYGLIQVSNWMMPELEVFFVLQIFM